MTGDRQGITWTFQEAEKRQKRGKGWPEIKKRGGLGWAAQKPPEIGPQRSRGSSLIFSASSCLPSLSLRHSCPAFALSPAHPHRLLLSCLPIFLSLSECPAHSESWSRAPVSALESPARWPDGNGIPVSQFQRLLCTSFPLAGSLARGAGRPGIMWDSNA